MRSIALFLTDWFDTKSDGLIINPHDLTLVMSSPFSSHSHHFFLYTVEILSVPSFPSPPLIIDSQIVSFVLVFPLTVLPDQSSWSPALSTALLPKRSFTEMVPIVYKIRNTLWPTSSLSLSYQPSFSLLPGTLFRLQENLVYTLTVWEL